MNTSASSHSEAMKSFSSARLMSKPIAILNLIGCAFILGALFCIVDGLILDQLVKLKIVVFAAAFTYIWVLGVLYKVEGRIGFYWILLLVTYPFFFGQQLLSAFDIETTRIMISIDQLADSTVWSASFFMMACVLAVTFGYMLARKLTPSNRLIDANASNESLRKACLWMFVFLLVPTLAYLVGNVSLSLTLGYGARIVSASSINGISNVAGILAQLMPYVLVGLFVTKKPGERWQVVCLLTYYGLYMVSGSRSSVFSAFPVFAFLWIVLYTKKNSRSQLVTLVLVLLLFGVLFSFISFARAFTSGGDFSDLGTLMVQNNVLVDILQEAGQTFVATGALIERVPRIIQQANGSTYLAGILYILPNGFTGNYYASVPSVDELVAPYLTSYGGVGSSFIAEGYLNFGPWSLMLFFCYGALIAWMSNLVDKELSKGNLMAIFVVAACFLSFSFYIRSDVRTFPRNFVWDILPIILVQQVFNVWLTRRNNCKGAESENASLNVAAEENLSREGDRHIRNTTPSQTVDSGVYTSNV